MTFYEVWLSVRNGSVAKRLTTENGPSEFVYIKFEDNHIKKKYDSNQTWVSKNLNDDDVKLDTWELV